MSEGTPRPGDDGQIVPLAAVFIVTAVLAMVVIAAVGRAAVERSQAQAAADGAALAAAADDRAAGGLVAAENGADLLAVRRVGRRIDVIVADRTSPATAAASAVEIPGRRIDGAGRRADLAPALLAALARADQMLGRTVPISSGYRSPEHQRRLWENRHRNPYPVAPPGTSRHEKGLAVDIPTWFLPTILPIAADAGLCRPLPQTDPVHFEICGS